MFIEKQINEGVDKIVSRIQKHLYDKLSAKFTNAQINAYPRIYASNTKEGIIAEHYLGNGEYTPVQYNEDALTFFFIENGSSKATDFKDYRTQLRLIVFSDLSKLYAEGERMDEKLLSDTLDVLHPLSHFYQPIDMNKGINNIMKEFRKENMKWQDMHPWFCFEINGEVEVTY